MDMHETDGRDEEEEEGRSGVLFEGFVAYNLQHKRVGWGGGGGVG